MERPSDEKTGAGADARARALSLALLARLWSHHRGAFPRLKAACERASASRVADVVVGAASACAFAAAADPSAATELVVALKTFLTSPTAPPAAKALSLEAIASMCDGDALEFYAAFKVVATRGAMPSLPSDPIVASRWTALLGRGATDAAAFPAAAASCADAAFGALTAGLDQPGPGDDDDDGENKEKRARAWVATRTAAYAALGAYDPVVVVEGVFDDDDDDDEKEKEKETDGRRRRRRVSSAAIAEAMLDEPTPFGDVVDAGIATVVALARCESETLARAALAPAAARGGGGGGGGASAAVASLAAADATLHRALQAIPRRLRTMPSLRGGAKRPSSSSGSEDADASAAEICPGGAGAHLFLFRPRVPPPTSDDDGDGEKAKARRAASVARERRDRAHAYRRAFCGALCGGGLGLSTPPASWSWHEAFAARSTHAFARRWIAAEAASRAGAAGTETASGGGDGALEEAKDAVFRAALDAFRDATTADGAQCAARALSSPALLRQDESSSSSSSSSSTGGAFGTGTGLRDDDDDDVERDPRRAETATDALLERLDDAREPDGSERGVAFALGLCVGSCRVGDAERRRAVASRLSRRAFDAESFARHGAAAVAAACEALGAMLVRLGGDVRRDGAGAGAWRVELLREHSRAFVARRRRSRGAVAGGRGRRLRWCVLSHTGSHTTASAW